MNERMAEQTIIPTNDQGIVVFAVRISQSLILNTMVLSVRI